MCASRVPPTGFNDRAWLARNLVQVRPNQERLSPSAGPAGGYVRPFARLAVRLLQANDPRHTPPSTKIVAASIIFTLPINRRLPQFSFPPFLSRRPRSPICSSSLSPIILERFSDIYVSEVVSIVSNYRFSLPPLI